MKKQVYLSLLLFVFTMTITGCGGDNSGAVPEVASPQSQGYGYINIRVIWPQDGVSGKCIISNGTKEYTLLSSMPAGTSIIKVKVLDRDWNLVLIENDPAKPATAVIKDEKSIEFLPDLKSCIKSIKKFVFTYIYPENTSVL